jgi:phospholipase A1
MRNFYFLVVICLIATVSSYAQDAALQDTIKAGKYETDTVTNNIKTFISHKTDAIVGSIFGPSKQLSNADSIIKQLDALPSFGIYKDNYFIVGTDMFKKPTQMNSDAKFQISIRQRLTNSTLPFKTYLFLTYSQKAFWNVFQNSFPFRDLNFNPTLGLGKALVRDNRFLGTISLQFEHESNGKDGLDSRSWNKVSFSSYFTLDDRWDFQAKAWIPIVDGDNNKDIVKYAGWGLVALNYSSPKRKYNIGCVVTKRGGVNLNANIELNFSVRLFSDDNQYLFLQYYNGYGESMLDYNQYRQRIRLGVVIKPKFMTTY